jgi:N-acetylglucosamine-6-sulfatase
MPSPSRLVLPILGVLLIVGGAVAIVKVNGEQAQAPPPTTAPRSTRAGGTPNVLMVMTDDQTLEAMRVLDNVDRYLVDQGTSFTNYFVSFPVCCPSRATYMSGQFAHNSGVLENIAPRGGYHKQNQDEYLPVWLQRAGYWTGSVGKYLNEYGQDGNIAPPKGWNRWYGLIDPTTYNYYNYDVSVDGQRQHFGDAPEDYQTDVLGGEVVRLLKERATTAQPWFLSWTPLAPHAVEPESAAGTSTGDTTNNVETKTQSIIEKFRAVLPKPAPEFEGRFSKERLPQPPSFNQKDTSTLPPVIRDKQPISLNLAGVIREGYQHELEALLSVDKWVKQIVDTLAATDQLDNTVVLFTSDNGYFHGEHRISFSKVFLYEQGVHLPFIMRGPGIPKAAKIPQLTANVDITPTILALTGAKATLPVDGRDLIALAKDPQQGAGRGILLENWRGNGKFHTDGIRTDRYKYLISDGKDEELYDLQNDPDEVVNLAHDPAMAGIKGLLVSRLDVLRTCAGPTCEGAAPR